MMMRIASRSQFHPFWILWTLLVRFAPPHFDNQVVAAYVATPSLPFALSSSNSRRTPRRASRSGGALSMATWSDSKAVQDYQAFLASGRQEIELLEDGPSVIVRPRASDEGDIAGGFDLPEAWVSLGGGQDVVVSPDQSLPAELAGRTEYPIYVALPPRLLEGFLSNLNPSFYDRIEDFVFFSGQLPFGNTEEILKERGYCRESMTQVLLSGLAWKRLPNDDGFQYHDATVNLGLDAIGEAKFAGRCSACGKWKGAVAERLLRHHVSCDVDFYREWRRKLWERSVLDAVFHVLGAVRDVPTTVKQVAQFYYEAEAADLVWEMSQLLRGWKAVTLLYGFEERMIGVAERMDVPCRLSPESYPYCWGTFVFLQSKSFVEYLLYAQQEKGLLPGIDLPVRDEASYASQMRPGNLRADGVI